MSIAEPVLHGVLRFSAALVIACAIVSACGGGDEPSPRTCRAGETAPCACPGVSGAQGTHRCNADGSRFGACEGCSDGGQFDATAEAGCQGDKDCDDGLGCNGAERCVEGSCQPGTLLCNNPAPAHCDIACVEDAGTGTCHTTAKDADSDGYLDAACPNADVPGDDCDDSNSAIHPGALEICDGKDNDCNGLIDIDDTLTVGGTTSYPVTATGANSPAVAWLGADNAYAVLWSQTVGTGAAEIWGGRYHQDFSPVGSTFKVSSGTTNTFNPSIAASGDILGVVWEQTVASPPPASQVEFQRIQAGSLTITEKFVGAGGSADIAAHSTNGWVVAWKDEQTPAAVNVSHLDAAGATLSSTGVDFMAPNSLAPRIARIGTTIGIVYAGGSTTEVVKLARIGEDAAGNISTDTVGPVDTNNPRISRVAIGSNDSFFGISWMELTTPPTTYFSKYDAQGALVCGPKLIGNSAVITKIVPDGDGFAMLDVEPNGSTGNLFLIRVSSTCEPSAKSPQPISGVPAFQLQIALTFGVMDHGSTGWLAAWSELLAGTNTQRVGIRSFGRYFCD